MRLKLLLLRGRQERKVRYFDLVRSVRSQRRSVELRRTNAVQPATGCPSRARRAATFRPRDDSPSSTLFVQVIDSLPHGSGPVFVGVDVLNRKLEVDQPYRQYVHSTRHGY